jgi:Na+/H+ antiporter
VHPVYLVVGLLIVLVVLVTIAQRLRLSYPIVLVIGGLVLALFPRTPEVKLEPEIVFLVFLPPLLYWDSLNTSWRDIRDNWRPISLLAIGLVFATTMMVMLAAHFLLGFSWGPAFVLGAVLGPTDTVAVAALLERFHLPRNLLAIVRGESLLNDASALVLYATAIHVSQVQSYVWGSVLTKFCVAAGGGIAVGLVIGWLMFRLSRLSSDLLVANTIALLTGFAAYLPADALHLSGVLAVVTAGLFFSQEGLRGESGPRQVQSSAIWEVLTFLLNGLLFILIGLQLRTMAESLPSESWRFLLLGGGVVSGTVLLVRIFWVFASALFPWASTGPTSARRSFAAWRSAALFSWVGIRGGISLAAALAIPSSRLDGSPFPRRQEIVILTFGVILVTLVLQGLSLPSLLRWLKFEAEGTEQAKKKETTIR